MRGHQLLLFFILTFAVASCKVYHDTTAHYNAYFLAKEKMAEVELALFGNPKDDYNEILQVYVKLDTNVGKSHKADLDYAIKKGAMPIQWHKNSKWVDDCWLLIGKARLYQGDFTNATRSFKYVNTNSDDPNARHASLVMLMRSFIDMDEIESANFVNAYIRKDTIPFSNENALVYHLTRAHYYRLHNKLDLMVKHIEVALPVSESHQERARLHFILAQVYHANGDLAKAYEHYQEVAKNRPGFDLAFHAEVNSFGLQDFKTQEDVDRAYAYYERMLKEDKYWTQRDKIYYEMGQFESRRGNAPKAIAHYNKALEVSGQNVAQQAFSYLRIGELHYKQQHFTEAAHYYDSASQKMPTSMSAYQETKNLAATLKQFQGHYETLQAQERLLALAKMDTASLEKFLTEEIEAEKQALLLRKEAEEKRILLSKQQTPPPTTSPFQEKGEALWYFYNLEAASSGKVAFARTWGNRRLEDNWRMSNKPFSNIETGIEDGDSTEVVQDDAADADQEDIFAGIRSVEARKKEIPYTAPAKEKCHEKVQLALFALGKAYYYDLKEPKGARTSFERLTAEYPKNDSVPEALYLLYSLCKDFGGCRPDVYKNQLINNYPSSFYAKLLANPDYLEEAMRDDVDAEKLYMQAYRLYENGQYAQARQQLSQIEEKYPKTQYLDKVDLLQALMVGRESEADKTAYYRALKQFIAMHKGSALTGYATKLMQAIPKEAISE